MSGASLPVLSLADQAEDPGGEPRTWAVVLAGGKGERLSRLTRHIYGEDRPKQYAALTGGKSLLRQTLERVGGLVPSDRTVVVTMAGRGRT
jgi:mannose-1-phosphate guanylyltransferase